MDHDYHVHTTYSDGSQMTEMVEAAEAAGLDAVGLADHCMVSERESVRRTRARMGFNFDRTFERRREAIALVREEADVEIYDGVEMDYHPRDEAAVAAFLDDAGFEYAIGSVHEVGGANVNDEAHFADRSRAEREAAVDRYFEKVVALVESGLFDVAAHPDLVERNPALRGLATDGQYRAVAAALSDSRTVPEINAGRVFDDYGEFHPHPAFLDVLADGDVRVTVGTDSHAPEQVPRRVEEIEALLAERGLAPVDVV